MTTSGWEGILDDDEEILWQGRPDTKIALKPRNLAGAAFGLLFAGIALIWMIGAARAGSGAWPFGLIHFTFGAIFALGSIYLGAFRRNRSWYTLTNHRAFIATDFPLIGKRLKSYPINKDTVLEYVDDEPASIIFARQRKRSQNGGYYTVKIGFERIPNGREVFHLFRQVQDNSK